LRSTAFEGTLFYCKLLFRVICAARASDRGSCAPWNRLREARGTVRCAFGHGHLIVAWIPRALGVGTAREDIDPCRTARATWKNGLSLQCPDRSSLWRPNVGIIVRQMITNGTERCYPVTRPSVSSLPDIDVCNEEAPTCVREISNRGQENRVWRFLRHNRDGRGLVTAL